MSIQSYYDKNRDCWLAYQQGIPWMKISGDTKKASVENARKVFDFHVKGRRIK